MFISDVALSHCNKAMPQKFVNDVMSAVYTDEYMTERSLGGTSSKESTKTGLPAEDIVHIIGWFYIHFRYTLHVRTFYL